MRGGGSPKSRSSVRGFETGIQGHHSIHIPLSSDHILDIALSWKRLDCSRGQGGPDLIKGGRGKIRVEGPDGLPETIHFFGNATLQIGVALRLDGQEGFLDLVVSTLELLDEFW